MKKLLLNLALATSFLVGCEKDEDDKISQAQECLDKAKVAADAAGCESLIDGINSEKANRIRCSLAILASGTTQDEILQAFQAMDSASSRDPVIEVSTVMGLGDILPAGTPNGAVDSAEETLAEEIKDICYTSESRGLRTMSQLIVFGTKAQVVADIAGDPEDPEAIKDNINSMPDADAGEFANDVYDLYCNPTPSNEDICSTLAAAGAGTGSDTAVGQALKACLANNSCN